MPIQDCDVESIDVYTDDTLVYHWHSHKAILPCPICGYESPELNQNAVTISESDSFVVICENCMNWG